MKRGTTLPALPSTLPKRTIANAVAERCAQSPTSISASRFVAPMTLDGFTALSVEMSTKRSAPAPCAISSTLRQPMTLFFTASSGVALHEGDVLVGGGVEHVVGPVAVRELAEAGGVAHVHHLRDHGEPRVHALEVAEEEVEAVLVDVGEDEARRLVVGELAADLAADGARRPRDEHPLALDLGADLRLVEAHGAAGQQVVRGEVLQHRHR